MGARRQCNLGQGSAAMACRPHARALHDAAQLASARVGAAPVGQFRAHYSAFRAVCLALGEWAYGSAHARLVRRPTQFALVIRGLVNAGYGVVALDGPAHGRSPGREANVVLFARALLEAASELPPLRAVIGHSMGGASALLATQMGLRSETLVTIATPSRILGLLRGFARHMGLPPEARAHFVRQVERVAGIPAAHFDVQRYQLDLPGLIVHAEDDQVVPVSEADLIHQAWFDSQLLRLPAGGHQRLLSEPLLVQAVLELLEQVPQTSLKALAS